MLPVERQVMKLEILNAELRIAGVDNIEDIGECYIKELKKKFGDDVNLNEITFLYMEAKDLIVLNKSHVRYDYYLDIIQSYLVLSDISKLEAIEKAPFEFIKQLFYELNVAANKRNALCKKAV